MEQNNKIPEIKGFIFQLWYRNLTHVMSIYDIHWIAEDCLLITNSILSVYFQNTASIYFQYTAMQYTESKLPVYFQYIGSILAVYFQYTASILPVYWRYILLPVYRIILPKVFLVRFLWRNFSLLIFASTSYHAVPAGLDCWGFPMTWRLGFPSLHVMGLTDRYLRTNTAGHGGDWWFHSQRIWVDIFELMLPLSGGVVCWGFPARFFGRYFLDFPGRHSLSIDCIGQLEPGIGKGRFHLCSLAI